MSIANTQTETIIEAGIIEENDQVQARVEHLKALENLVGNVYPNKYERSKITGGEDTITNILHFAPIREIVGEIKAHVATLAERERPNPELKEKLNAKLKDFGTVSVSGRLTTPLRGNFVHLTDGKNKLQIYCKKNAFSLVKNDADKTTDAENAWTAYNLLDQGDFVGASGYLFLTNTGELSVHVETFQFLSKALLPMPDKMHGIADPELRRRYRYADLIASSLQVEHEGLTTREVFERRAKLISGMRRFLDDAGYIEVETPMLTPKATGAAATPFETHHNALDIPLYARIAPELYLKRLTVGGFEKVYELNRNFRNEGLSHKHNPEFTMLEFYCAYMDVNGMMDFAEAMIKESVNKATGGSLVVNYDGKEIDFSKFERLTMKESIAKYWFTEFDQLNGEKFDISWLENPTKLATLDGFVGMIRQNKDYPDFFGEPFGEDYENDSQRRLALKEQYWNSSVETSSLIHNIDSKIGMAQSLVRLFENVVEEQLINPTFIVDYPKSISPLSKASPDNPQIAERFELFINGMEVANGFSELNDPQEQYERFVDQMREREGGDAEAMVLDEDYIRALAYGMPPAAGIGIGIDRLVMLLTDKHSIRDVILFPHMRPIVREDGKKSEGEEEQSEN